MAHIWQGKTVLVVDDSSLMQEELSELYSEMGMRVIDFARSGVEAFAKYERHKPDLVSLDIVMPEMHGIDCYRKIIAQYPEARMIFVSCLASDHIIGDQFKEEFPAYLFIGKPVNRDQLQASLNKVLGSSDSKGATPSPSPAKEASSKAAG